MKFSKVVLSGLLLTGFSAIAGVHTASCPEIITLSTQEANQLNQGQNIPTSRKGLGEDFYIAPWGHYALPEPIFVAIPGVYHLANSESPEYKAFIAFLVGKFPDEAASINPAWILPIQISNDIDPQPIPFATITCTYLMNQGNKIPKILIIQKDFNADWSDHHPDYILDLNIQVTSNFNSFPIDAIGTDDDGGRILIPMRMQTCNAYQEGGQFDPSRCVMSWNAPD